MFASADTAGSENVLPIYTRREEAGHGGGPYDASVRSPLLAEQMLGIICENTLGPNVLHD
jgi:hypothetical protein